MASDRLGSLRGPAVIAVGLAFAAWTWVTITDRLPSWIDAGSRHRHLTEGGAMAQIQQTLAMVSHPVVITVAVCGLAWWAWQTCPDGASSTACSMPTRSALPTAPTPPGRA